VAGRLLTAGGAHAATFFDFFAAKTTSPRGDGGNACGGLEDNHNDSNTAAADNDDNDDDNDDNDDDDDDDDGEPNDRIKSADEGATLDRPSFPPFASAGVRVGDLEVPAACLGAWARLTRCDDRSDDRGFRLRKQ